MKLVCFDFPFSLTLVQMRATSKSKFEVSIYKYASLDVYPQITASKTLQKVWFTILHSSLIEFRIIFRRENSNSNSDAEKTTIHETFSVDF